MKMITINNIEYEVVKNVGDAVDVEEITKCLTDYFDAFDYVFGDYAYGKLRLKGFNNKENKNCKSYNDIANLEEYIEKYCAFGCRHFLLARKSSKES